MQAQDDRFLAAISAEKLKAQERRGTLISRKLAWATGLFAVGATKLPLVGESQMLLFFVPIVALVYDLYILGENYGIKRMGSFVRQKQAGSLEAEWEDWLRPRRDPYSWYALYLTSWIILFACVIVLFLGGENLLGLGTWFVSIALFMAALYYDSTKTLRALDAEGGQPAATPTHSSEQTSDLK